MAPVGAFLAGAGGFGATAAVTSSAFLSSAYIAGASVGTFFTSTILGKLLTTVALTALRMALVKRPTSQVGGIRTSRTQTGGTTPASFILGAQYATEGQLVAPPMSHGSAGGVPNAYLTYVVELGDIAGQSVEAVILDGEATELGDTPHPDYGLPIEGRFTDHAWVKIYDGTQTAADPMLLDKYGDYDERPWGADMVGSGIPYAILTFKFNREIFNGFPKVRFVCGGIPLYDPRQDSSVGGSGSQRWADPATWTPSANNAVQIYNIKRGIDLGGGYRWGGNASAEDLPLSNWFAAMNACDAAVDLDGGGTEPAYRGAYEAFVTDEPADVVEELLKGCAGRVSEVGGVWKIRVGGPGLPVYFFTDDDLIITETRELDPFPQISDTFNGVQATYPDPDALWQTKDAPARFNSEYEAEDGGERLVADLQLPAVPYALQVQRLMRGYIEDERRFRRHVLTLPPDAGALEPLDAVSWSSEHNGYIDKIFEIPSFIDTLVQGNPRLSLREADPTDYDWQPDFELPSPIGSPRVVIAPEIGVPGFNVEGIILRDADNTARRPALRIRWSSAIEVARGVEWQIRVQGAAELASEGASQNITAGEAIVSEGILPQTYEVRARLITDIPRVWTNWVTVAAPDVRLSAKDLIDELTDKIDAAFDRHDAALEDATGAVAELRDAALEAYGPLDTETSLTQRLDVETARVDVQTDRLDVETARLDVQTDRLDVQEAKVDVAIARLDFAIPQVRDAGAQLDDVWAFLTELERVTFATNERLVDAGIYVDPENGTVRIAGIEATRQRVASAELRIDGVAAEISAKASITYVNDVVSNALLDPTQIPVVDDLKLRMTQVEVSLDAEIGRIDLLTDTLTVNGGLVTMTSVAAELDSLNAAIALRATQADFDAALERLDGAEIVLNALDVPSITQTVTSSRRIFGEVDDLYAESLADLVDGFREREAIREANAAARQQLRAFVDDSFAAEAAARLELKADVDGNKALIVAEQKARATATESLVSDVTQLQADLTTAEGDLAGTVEALEEVTGRVSETEGSITAEGQRVEFLGAAIRDVELTGDDFFAQSVADLWDQQEERDTLRDGISVALRSARVFTEAKISAEAAERALLAAGLDATKASLTEERLARATTDAALAQQITTLSAALDLAEDGLAATSTAVEQLETRVTSTEGEITSQGSAITQLQADVSDAAQAATVNAGAINSLDVRVSSAEGDLDSQGTAITALENRVTTAEGEIDGNAEAITQLDTRVTSTEGEITSQGSAITQLQADVSDIAQEATANAGAISSLDVRVSSAEGDLDSQGTAITALENRVTTAEGEIDGNAEAITQLDTRVTSTEGEITSQGSAITQLQADVSDIAQEATANAGAISSLDVRVSSAEGDLDSQGTAITALENRVTTAEGEIDGNAEAITQLDTRVTSTEGEITSQGSAITQLQADVSDAAQAATANAGAINSLDARVVITENAVTSQGTAINALENRISDAETDASANATAIDQLDTRLTSAEGTITSQSNAITQLQADVFDVAQNATANAGAISSLDTRVTSTEGTISSQSTRLSAVETGLNNADDEIEANALAVSGLDARVSQSEGDVTALASRADVLEVAVQEGQILVNGSFSQGDLRGWSELTANVKVLARGEDATVAVVGAPTPYILRLAESTDPVQGRAAAGVPVSAGEAFEITLQAATWSNGLNTIAVRLSFFDADGTFISGIERSRQLSSSVWIRPEFDRVIAPANAATMRVILRRNAGGNGHSYVASLRVERVSQAANESLARIEAVEAVKVDADGALAAVTQEITASYGSLTALAEATAFAQATVDGITAGYVFRLNEQNVFEMVSVDDGVEGPVSTARLAADYVQITGLTQIDTAVLGQLAASQAFIDNLTVGRGEIETVLESDNYAEDGQGLPTSGVQIDFQTGEIKTAAEAISRNIVAASGSFPVQAQTFAQNADLRTTLEWELVPTGYELPLDQVWMPSNKTFLAYAAYEGTVSAPGGITGNDEFWGCFVEVVTAARWNGPQQIRLNIEFRTKGVTGISAGNIRWVLYQVT
ncbi:hypothetical protein [Thalassococcus sp. S3]|uniref:hypothetical protein n=1 Tax=Thalassococcus sp. S3 TaxID=2017482 RepID=UPI001024629F|nr:hypothetical protein [Thalassococcus sp. S3]QBF31488.1 hypothetical protein CFI11_09695 [Thalassococcus sp. S3]